MSFVCKYMSMKSGGMYIFVNSSCENQLKQSLFVLYRAKSEQSRNV